MFGKSWKTTVAGLGGALSIILAQVQVGLEQGWEAVEWSIVVAAITTLIGLWSARDNDVSSEDAGAK